MISRLQLRSNDKTLSKSSPFLYPKTPYTLNFQFSEVHMHKIHLTFAFNTRSVEKYIIMLKFSFKIGSHEDKSSIILSLQHSIYSTIYYMLNMIFSNSPSRLHYLNKEKSSVFFFPITHWRLLLVLSSSVLEATDFCFNCTIIRYKL